jgi:hypothetical protein
MVAADPKLRTTTSDKPPSAARITQLAADLDDRLSQAIDRIGNLNSETKFIAINAKMEAMRAGGLAGRAFGVVAQAIQKVSKQTADVATTLAEETHQTVVELRQINESLATTVLGDRFANLALVNIDLIDRNLYERTCDVRWWATDSSVVEACASPTQSSLKHVTQRLGQILDAYTVYFDIVLCDLEGRVIANGRPQLFSSAGSCHADKEWFRSALACGSGDQFGFRGMNTSSLVNNQRCLVYSASVRQEGQLRGKPTGVLGVIFRWDALAQTIVERTPLNADEKANARVLIIEPRGRILADTDRCFGESFDIAELAQLMSSPRSFAVLDRSDGRTVIGHARSPGYETYATGWHSLVISRMS